LIKSEIDIAVRQADPSEWDELVGSFSSSTVFHTLAWLKTIQEAHGVRPVLTRADRAGQCIAVWPFLEMRKGPLRVIGSPLPGWSTAYLGPLFARNAPVQDTIKAFLEHSLFRRYAYFACKLIDHETPIDLQQCGFNEVMRFDTYLVDLSLSEEQLWSNLKSECRTRIRKAEKRGLKIHEEDSSEFIDDFWSMSLETFAKARIQPTHTLEFVQSLWRHLHPRGRVVAYSAFVDGQRAATLVLPFDGRTIYYWGGAAFLKYRDVPAHNLLHWQAILEAKRKGLERYDMISTIGGPGRFKSTFGPEIAHMATHWERSPTKWLAALKEQYRRYLLKRRQTNLTELVGSGSN
jgi:hypothetical protein